MIVDEMTDQSDAGYDVPFNVPAPDREHGSFSDDDNAKTSRDHQTGNNVIQDEITDMAPDGGWSWVVLVAAFCIYCSQGFVFTGFSVLYVALIEHFNSDHAMAAWIISVYAFAGNIIGIPIGSLVQKYGCRPVAMTGIMTGTIGICLCYFLLGIPYLCLTFGVIGGISGTCMSLATSVSLQRYFDKRRALANGLGVSGLSFGGFISAPINNMLLNTYGLSGTFLVIAGIWLQNAVFASLLRPVKSRRVKPRNDHQLEHTEDVKETGSTRTNGCSSPCKILVKDMLDFTVLKNVDLVLFLIGTCLFNFGTMGFFGHYLSRMTYYGVERHLAITFQTMMMVATGGGRLFAAFIANINRVDIVLYYGTAVTVSGCVVLSFGFVTTTNLFAIYGVLHGFMAGQYFSLQPSILVDVSEVSNIAKVTGLFHTSVGITMLTVIPLTGFIFDVSGSYDLPYFVIGSIHLSASCVLLALAVRRRRRRITQDQISTVEDNSSSKA